MEPVDSLQQRLLTRFYLFQLNLDLVEGPVEFAFFHVALGQRPVGLVDVAVSVALHSLGCDASDFLLSPTSKRDHGCRCAEDSN
jgi:hypothetical protein